MSLNLSNQVRAQFENTKNVQKNPEGKTEKKKRREKPTKALTRIKGQPPELSMKFKK